MHSLTPCLTLCVKFRLMRPEDALALQVLRHRAILECAPQFGTPAEIEAARGPNYYRRQILEGRQRGHKAFLGGWEGGGLVAMAGIRTKKDRQGVLGLITGMFVCPEWRGVGVGEALLQQAIERVEALWKIRRCQMNVEVRNRTALDLYLKNGFQILSLEKNAYCIQGTAHDVYLLERLS